MYTKILLKIIHKKIDGVIICGNWVNAFQDSTLLVKEIFKTLKFLDNNNVPSVIIGQNETYSMTYPLLAARENEYEINISKRYITKESMLINSFLKRNFKDRYIDVFNNRGRVPLRHNIPYMADRNHLSIYGAELAMHKIMSDYKFIKFLNHQ